MTWLPSSEQPEDKRCHNFFLPESPEEKNTHSFFCATSKKRRKAITPPFRKARRRPKTIAFVGLRRCPNRTVWRAVSRGTHSGRRRSQINPLRLEILSLLCGTACTRARRRGPCIRRGIITLHGGMEKLERPVSARSSGQRE